VNGCPEHYITLNTQTRQPEQENRLAGNFYRRIFMQRIPA
jgi:hypothetical protein